MARKSLFRVRNTPSVPFVLHVDDADGSSFDLSYQLAFDMNAFAAFEEKTGMNFLRNLGAILDAPSATTATVLFWCALLLNHPEYNCPEGLDAVRKNISLANGKEAQEKCVEAFIGQLPADRAAEMRKRLAGEKVQSPLAQGPATE